MNSKKTLAAVLAAAASLAASLSEEASAAQLLVFLVVASHEGEPLSMGDIARQLEIVSPSVSRNVALLSEYKKYQQRGQGLLLAREDLTERRRKLVTLTGEGVKAAEEAARRAARKL